MRILVSTRGVAAFQLQSPLVRAVLTELDFDLSRLVLTRLINDSSQ